MLKEWGTGLSTTRLSRIGGSSFMLLSELMWLKFIDGYENKTTTNFIAKKSVLLSYVNYSVLKSLNAYWNEKWATYTTLWSGNLKGIGHA